MPAYAPIQELMDAVDSYIPDPVRAVDKPFLMPIEDVFGIKGRGTVATGRIERGVVKVGEEIEIVGIQAQTRKIVVTGVEMFKKLLDQGEAGDNVGCLLRGIERDDIERGQVLAKPGSIKPHTKFDAEVYVLTKEEGGRHTPFFNGYRPQFYLRTTDVTGRDRAARRRRDDHARRQRRDDVELITPIAIEIGQRFAIREGGRTVGAGAITSITSKRSPWQESKRVRSSSWPAPSASSGTTRRARTRRTIRTGSSCSSTARGSAAIRSIARRSSSAGTGPPQGCSSIGRAAVSKTGRL